MSSDGGTWRGVVYGSTAGEGLSSGFGVWCQGRLISIIMSPLFELGAGILQGEEWTEQVTECEPAKVAQELLDYWCTQKAL